MLKDNNKTFFASIGLSGISAVFLYKYWKGTNKNVKNINFNNKQNENYFNIVNIVNKQNSLLTTFDKVIKELQDEVVLLKNTQKQQNKILNVTRQNYRIFKKDFR